MMMVFVHMLVSVFKKYVSETDEKMRHATSRSTNTPAPSLMPHASTANPPSTIYQDLRPRQKDRVRAERAAILVQHLLLADRPLRLAASAVTRVSNQPGLGGIPKCLVGEVHELREDHGAAQQAGPTCPALGDRCAVACQHAHRAIRRQCAQRQIEDQHPSRKPAQKRGWRQKA